MTSFLDIFKAGLLIDDISFILILYAFFNQFYYLVDPMQFVIKRKKYFQKTFQNDKGETIAPGLT